MTGFFIFMAPAFFMCLILVGVCGYVGIHVIMREVIFIDIALAQVAALGASVGMFFNLDLPTGATVTVTLGAALLIIALIKGVQLSRREA